MMKIFGGWFGIITLLLSIENIGGLLAAVPTVSSRCDSLCTGEMIGVLFRDGKYFWKIPELLLGRDLLLVCRIESAAAGNRSRNDGYAGDEVNTALYRFEKRNAGQLDLRKITLSERSDTANPVFPAYRESNFQGIAMTFRVKEYADEHYVIDVTDWLQSDSDLLYFSGILKGALRLGGQQKDKSEILSVHSDARNLEIRAQKTYTSLGNGNTVTYVLNSSFLLLPEQAMIPRLYDQRIGYFTTDYQDFDTDPYELHKTRVINRWRLEPSVRDRDRYFRGELVEPVNPIVFYIDPSTPEPWIKYMIQGVNDWQKAFEKAGFKNAIYARKAPSPKEDSTWSSGNVRFSVIDYTASGVANAFGKFVSDPRSGEIVQSRIHFHHSLLQLLQSWYFVQCAPQDSAARKFPLGEEQMGRMIRMIISHEVGHAIGLSHNFGGTSLFSVKQLRDADSLRKYGHTTSIMDYTRLNYVIQPEDSIDSEWLFPRIGAYDEWAVEWGYRLFPGIENARQEIDLLDKKTTDKNRDLRFRFGREDSPADPRYQSEDLGDNPMEANQLGIANLQIVIEHLEEWTRSSGIEGKTAQIYKEVFCQYRRYLGHVLKWIGGEYEIPAGRKGEIVLSRPVEKEKQQEAFRFIARNFLSNPPLWLFPAEICNCIPENHETTMEVLCNQVCSGLLNRQTLTRLLANEEDHEAYSLCEFFADLNKTLWKSGNEKEQATPARRLIEKTYVATLCRLYQERDLKDNGDMNPVLLMQLQYLKKIMHRKRHSRDSLQAAHVAYMQSMIVRALE